MGTSKSKKKNPFCYELFSDLGRQPNGLFDFFFYYAGLFRLADVDPCEKVYKRLEKQLIHLPFFLKIHFLVTKIIAFFSKMRLSKTNGRFSYYEAEDMADYFYIQAVENMALFDNKLDQILEQKGNLRVEFILEMYSPVMIMLSSFYCLKKGKKKYSLFQVLFSHTQELEEWFRNHFKFSK